jgi:hypothetical protein
MSSFKVRFVFGLFACSVASVIAPPGFLLSAAKASSEQPYRIGPATSALGGSGRAAVDAAESGWLNPAALVHIHSYHFAVSSQQSHRDAGDGYSDFGVMLADGGEEKIAAGSFSFVQRKTLRGGAGAVSADQRDFQFSMAGFFPGRSLSMGLTYRRLIHEQPGGFDVTQDNFAIGFLYPMTEKFGLALTGHDLAGASDSVAPEARMIPTVGVGMHFVPHEILHVRADLVRPLEANDDGRNNVHFGIESWFQKEFAFRLGSAWLEARNENWLTTGIGFKGPRLSFGYSFEKEIRSNDGSRHTFDLWLPL